APPRLVAEDDDPGMLGPIGIDDRIEIVGAELSSQLLDVVRLTREEVPAWAHALGLRERAQNLGRVVLGIERDREKRDVPADAFSERFLDFEQIQRRHRTGDPTTREHEVDRDDLALDEVVVETDRPALVGREVDVEQVLIADRDLSIGGMRRGCLAWSRWRRGRGRADGGALGAPAYDNAEHQGDA